ncbi:unnamed protein product [Dovyalis caffra]|uniref:SHSP domain-containing protein n=1 Tax=Dovyalis caffra TaxID=77055 RepID=A0AAV1QVP1_9ROSI|nr:unnamed protein product [Dovyalis caffra]
MSIAIGVDFSEKDIECRIIAPSHYIRVCSNPALKTWHFNTLFEDIPEKYNLHEAKTKFDDGSFTITVPKVAPAQTSTGPKASEATERSQEAPSLQESPGPEKSGDGPAKQETWTTKVDEEITEAKDVEGPKTSIESEQMSQKGQDQVPSKANFQLVFTRKQQMDDQSSVGQVGDQKAMEEDKEKSAESVGQEKEKEKEKEGSSSSMSEKDIVTNVVTETRYIVDKCTILSLILAVGAYAFYTFYGQSRRKNQ